MTKEPVHLEQLISTPGRGFTGIYRRLGVKPGNLNGSCVRDPVAGDYFEISGPRARACPWGW